MSTEIVKAGEALPSQEEIEQQLDRLEAGGDSQSLHEVARMAWAYREYESRAGATERARHFSRIKVMAEARIGSIDLDLHPRGRGQLEFNGQVVVGQATRGEWRLCGLGLRTGQLESAMREAEKEREIVSTHQVCRVLREAGVMWVSTKPLLERYWTLHRDEGLTVRELGRRSGIYLHSHLTPPGTVPRFDKMRRETAERIAPMLGLAPNELQGVPKRNVGPRGRRSRPPKKLRGGRLDTTYTLIRRTLAELDAAAGTEGRWGTGEAYEHLYKAEEVIGRALRRAE